MVCRATNSAFGAELEAIAKVFLLTNTLISHSEFCYLIVHLQVGFKCPMRLNTLDRSPR